MHLRHVVLGCTGLFLFACSDGGTGPDRVTLVTITPAADTINAIGDTLALSATLEDEAGEAVSGVTAEWSSTDEGIATVDAQGGVVSVATGTARIVAAADGAADTATIVVRQVAAIIALSSATDSIVPGDSIRLTAAVVDSNGVAMEGMGDFTWTSSDEAIASTDATGSIFGHSPGTVTVEASFEEVSGSATVTVEWLRLVDVDAGARHTCGLTAGGDAYCWGLNLNGQLGDGTTTDRAEPVRVVGGLDLTALSVGNWHTCGLTAAAEVLCWGLNVDGQLGTGSNEDAPVPTPVPVEIDRDFTAVSAGGLHTCALATDGDTFCWGDNPYGQVGNGASAHAQPTPVQVVGDVSFASVTAGGHHTCGLTDGGDAHCWGYNRLGELGIGSNDTLAHSTPEPVTGGFTFAGLAAGGSHACGFTDDGAVYCWGEDNQGEIGDGPGTTECMIGTFSHDCRVEPSAVDAPVAFAFVAPAAGAHACAIATAGEAYCWGADDSGQLGDGGGPQGSDAPESVAGGHGFAVVAGGLRHSCGITTDGLTYCWGSNDAGRLGDGGGPDQRAPTLVARQQP